MMTRLTRPVADLLRQLQELLECLTEEQYTQNVPLLSDASLGQHTRHIIEFFQELNRGYESGRVNYDERKRNYETETSRDCAIGKLQQIAGLLDKEDKPLYLVADYGDGQDRSCRIRTNYQRELIYNLEHTVHHMALIRIGVHSLSTVTLPENFGVALSTIKYRKTCAR